MNLKKILRKNTWLFLIALFLSNVSLAQTSQFGRYIGTLTHDSIQKQQLAKIDFVTSRSNDNELELKAILTLHFGGFASGEYVSFHFNRVIFNLLTSSLVFDSPEEDVTLTTTSFSNGELVAQFRSAIHGEVGELNLRLNQAATPTLPLIEPVNGEYSGMCEDGNMGTMQIHTMRSTEDSSRVGNPFGTYELRGQFGKFGNSLCDDLVPLRACQELSLNQSAYNFYSGELTFIWDVQTWDCKVNGDSIDCGDNSGCTFNRTSNETASRILTPPQTTPVFTDANTQDPVVENAVTGIAGTYSGYMHHEYLDRFQPIRISLVTYQEIENGVSNLRISATANLFFGDQNSREFLSYRFEPRNYPNILNSPQFTLSSFDSDVDAFLKITSIRDGIVRGEWNSLHFGRVGTFEARVDAAGTVALPQGGQLLSPLTAYYDNIDNFDMNIQIFHGRTPPNTENPFFPLDIGGWFRYRYDGGGPRHPISGGSYDFYTGKIGFERGNNRWSIGKRRSNQQINLRTISNVYGSILQDYTTPRPFVLSTDGPTN
jgi:hypothetical protein